MHAELCQRQGPKCVGDLDIVEPLTASRAVPYGRAAFELQQHQVCAASQKPGVIPGAIAQQRQAEIEAAGERHLTALGAGELDIVRRMHQRRLVLGIRQAAGLPTPPPPPTYRAT